ncbi:MAG TPA: hypothetical protein VNF99_09200 [Stellaceae bacterium]|nr:hypothetical protein [Stellaceae bacterium]
MSERLWFRAKTYGWGWTPATWEGWAVMLAYIVLVGGWVAYLAHWRVPVDIIGFAFALGLPIFALTLILLVICRLKGERPRWRWGK